MDLVDCSSKTLKRFSVSEILLLLTSIVNISWQQAFVSLGFFGTRYCKACSGYVEAQLENIG